MGVIRTDPGTSVWTIGRIPRIAFDTSTALAPAWRFTAMTTVAEGTG